MSMRADQDNGLPHYQNVRQQLRTDLENGRWNPGEILPTEAELARHFGLSVGTIRQAVLAQWLRPDSVPIGQSCTINIRQLPGGQVIEAKVSGNCPYDEAGRRSIEAAVLRAQPLPYRGFESVFQRNLTFHFTAQDR